MKRAAKRILVILIIAAVFLNILAAVHAYRFTHFYLPAEGTEKFRAESAGAGEKLQALVFGVRSYRLPVKQSPSFPFQTITLTTRDGVLLESWYGQPADSNNASGTVILFHGHGGNKEGVLKEASAFVAFGYNVLLTDFRAHGNSEGTVCTIGYDEAIDVKAAWDFIVKKGETNIIFWGISLGAAAEMRAVTGYGLTPSKMIIEMPFASLHEAVQARCRIMGIPEEPVASLLTFWGGVEHGFDGFSHNPADYAKKISCPVLVQWGRKDVRVAPAEIHSVFRSLAGRKWLMVYDRSGHQSLCASENEKWTFVVDSFLGR